MPLLAVAALLAFLRVALYAQLLSVGNFGLLSKAFLISGIFGVAGSLGFHLLAHRELPALFIHKRYRCGMILLGRGAIVTSFVACCLALLPLFGVQPLGMAGAAFTLGLIHGWAQQIFMLSVIESKSRLEMTRYAVRILAKVALSTCGGIAAAIIFGNALMVVAVEFVTTFLLTIAIVKSVLHRVNLRLAVITVIAAQGQTVREWRIAFVLLVTSLLAFFSFNADRWIAALLLPIDGFGIYSFAWIALLAAQSVQFLINTGVFPVLVRRHASAPGLGAFRLTTAVSFMILFAGVVVAAIGIALVSWGISRWYPAYVAAVPLLPYLFIASVFRLADFWSSYLIVIRRESTLLGIQALTILILVSLWLIYGSKSAVRVSADNLAQLALVLAVGSYTISAFVAFWHRNPVGR